MRFQIAELTVIETKFEPLSRSNRISLDLGKGTVIHALIPFEHLVKVGDKIALEIEVPLALAKVTQ
jgi:hypothetical protein